MEIKITQSVHPYEKTKDDFILKGAYSELVMLLVRHERGEGNMFSLEDDIARWERENIPSLSPKALEFCSKFRRSMAAHAGNVAEILRDLRKNKTSWIDE